MTRTHRLHFQTDTQYSEDWARWLTTVTANIIPQNNPTCHNRPYYNRMARRATRNQHSSTQQPQRKFSNDHYELHRPYRSVTFIKVFCVNLKFVKIEIMENDPGYVDEVQFICCNLCSKHIVETISIHDFKENDWISSDPFFILTVSSYMLNANFVWSIIMENNNQFF